MLAIGLIALIVWRIGQLTQPGENLLSNAGFEQAGLAGWRALALNGGQARPKSAADGNTVLELLTPAAEAGSGAGQYLPATSHQRYKLALTYRATLAAGQDWPKLALRLSQFDQTGHLIEQAEILEQLPQSERAELTRSLDYPDGSAGRLMQTEFIAAPPDWTVGQTIDYMREKTEDLPERFFEIYVLDPERRKDPTPVRCREVSRRGGILARRPARRFREPRWRGAGLAREVGRAAEPAQRPS